MKDTTEKGYIVRSTVNPALVFCTNGLFMAKDFYGPGHIVGIKIYKSRKAAEKVRNGVAITVEEYTEKSFRLAGKKVRGVLGGMHWK